MFRRGDVVLVLFPNSDLSTFKKRPALIVQDLDVETGLGQVVISLITSNLNRLGPTRLLIVKDSPEGQSMNLQSDSIVVTDNLQTVRTFALEKVIGRCPVMHRVSDALRITLGL